MFKTSIALAAFALAALGGLPRVQGLRIPWPPGLPVYDHVVIVVEENKDYEEVIGNEAAPYINGTLKAAGANLTQMYAEEHNSEGNYFWLFSGNNQSVGYEDAIPDSQTRADYPFRTPNLAERLLQRGYTFRGYAEDLPSVGSTVDRAGLYARKHVPWISFANIPQGPNADSSVNLQFLQFPDDFTKLPTVTFVIPNLIDDMHDRSDTAAVAVRNGDDWLRTHLDAYYRWARDHNSLLVLTFDENDDTGHALGLTDPASDDKSIRNRIPTILAGAHVKPGDYPEGRGMTHVNLLRTLEAMYGLT
ncbi:MAG TPA: alkaline phosphatase family protein, partial [Bacteroidota bacterium]